MDHKSLIDTLASRLGITSAEATWLSDSFVGVVRDSVSRGDIVSLPGFGSFEPRYRAERISVQPSTGRRMLIPPRLTIAFRPATALRRKIRDMKPRSSTSEIPAEDGQ